MRVITALVAVAVPDSVSELNQKDVFEAFEQVASAADFPVAIETLIIQIKPNVKDGMSGVSPFVVASYLDEVRDAWELKVSETLKQQLAAAKDKWLDITDLKDI